MNFDLTRHGGYELTWSTTGLVLIGALIALSAVVIIRTMLEQEWHEKAVNPLLKLANVAVAGAISLLPLFGVLLAMGSLPFGQGMGNVKSTPWHTNILQESKKLPESRVTTITVPGLSMDGIDLRGGDYGRAITTQLEKHYKVEILTVVPIQLYKGNYGVDMGVTIKANAGTPQEHAQECTLRALDVKSKGNDSNDSMAPATSFTGYLLCNGSEAPKR